MDCTGGTGLALHLDDIGDDTPQIWPTFQGPGVSLFTHLRRRRDRVDGDDFAESVRDRSGSFVAIDRDVVGISAHQAKLAMTQADQPGEKGPMDVPGGPA